MRFRRERGDRPGGRAEPHVRRRAAGAIRDAENEMRGFVDDQRAV